MTYQITSFPVSSLLCIPLIDTEGTDWKEIASNKGGVISKGPDPSSS